ncbi:Hydrogenase transcriptional regulatory protein HoxA [Planktothrix tepida]|uniref:Response regulator receiver (CheY) and GAF domain protein n=2 Tax=Planktothrix TaxID=54304 RepID=A0A1J1LKQ8_9CYAN|nr:MULTISPECIES: response regulator [Planktothrix]CAD5941580.1 Hydrogenase transcriptional regulatory protein HoxA [Planktothrix tepida]CAD5969855.1 Hydrogenase transcriptional regulatory protein HoxA [Planktothrix pseudagardhii]CUR33079.1 Response regulator receiver (CheY) and GAF domain protein [Planktothrix tepida PCC 9214]
MPQSKLKLMVVDDERDNLDLLYRTFRREFQVFRADSPSSAMNILDTEGEMAVIISDQSMPEMTGIQFFTLVTDRFPDTIRVLLTGYSEDALELDSETITSTLIFKCITKPWEPEAFKAIIQKAVETYKASKERDDNKT